MFGSDEHKKELVKKTKDQLIDQVVSLTNNCTELGNDKVTLKKVLAHFVPDGISVEAKMLIAMDVYGYIKIQQKGERITLEYPIDCGWSSINGVDLNDVLDKILFIKK